ncbi:hypothetical protein ACQ9BO_11275 [Flavobacterium sp. P21]|uniref:hypothetical protein n=1 Tax=Flavobacterium sp. P21 TaxID=3423948 RepID=UPI003D66C067
MRVLFFTDERKVFETKSNKSGYFKFNRVHFSNFGVLTAEYKNREELEIKNSISHATVFAMIKDTLTNTATLNIDYKYEEKR